MDNKPCLVAESGTDSIHKQVMNTNHIIIDGDRVRVTSRTDPTRSAVLQRVKGEKLYKARF